MEQHILASIIQVASCTFLLFAGLLWIRRNGNRSRVYFAVACGVCGIDLFIRIFTVYGGTPFTFEVLHPAALYMTLIEIPLFLFYLIEVVNPGWLTWRKIGLLCTPWLLWNVCLLIPGFRFRELDTFGDIFQHIGEANVWLRLLFGLSILPYSILLYRLPCNWRRSSADRSLIQIYSGGFVVMALFFISSSMSGSIPVSSLHLAYGTLFCFCLTYYELFIRLQVPKDDEIFEPASAEAPCAVTGETVETTPEGQWDRISREIENRRLWRTPDMNIIDLARLLRTNRTDLSRLFQEQGRGGYKEFINRRRIADFLELMDKNPRINMQDAFFDAGFRSRTTALRNFKGYMGMGPSEYFNSLTKEQ